MWLFTPFGFFSCVAHRDEPDFICVRARARADLLAFLTRFPELDGHVPDGAIIATPDADYPYRAIVTRTGLSEVLSAFVLDELAYDNFKSEVGRVAGSARAKPLHDVWEVMHAVEDADARRPVLASGHEGSAQSRHLEGPRHRRT